MFNENAGMLDSVNLNPAALSSEHDQELAMSGGARKGILTSPDGETANINKLSTTKHKCCW